MGMQVGAATMKDNTVVPSNLNTVLPYNPAIPLLGIYAKKSKTLIQKNICTPVSLTALFTITEIWKQPKCLSIDK